MQSRGEFIALLAMLFAMVAFSIDSMLPALPRMAEELTPDAPNRAQLVLTAFVAGLGVGTLFAGPISDAIGRKPTITIGFAIWGANGGADAFTPNAAKPQTLQFIAVQHRVAPGVSTNSQGPGR